MNDEMELDIIKEVINIGIGDAAASLSELVKTRVVIRSPDISVMDVNMVSSYIRKEMKALGVYISQDFEGLVKGKTILCYTKDCSLSLLNALYPESVKTSSLTASAMATLQEIGNIIMVSCVTTLADMIEGTLKFFMPTVTEEISDTYFQNLLKDMEVFDKAIVVKNEMVVAGDKVTDSQPPIEGHLFVLIGFDDFQKVIAGLKKKLST